MEINIVEYHRRIKLVNHCGENRAKDWAKVPFRMNTRCEPKNEQVS